MQSDNGKILTKTTKLLFEQKRRQTQNTGFFLFSPSLILAFILTWTGRWTWTWGRRGCWICDSSLMNSCRTSCFIPGGHYARNDKILQTSEIYMMKYNTKHTTVFDRIQHSTHKQPGRLMDWLLPYFKVYFDLNAEFVQ